ncbi:MULTISPECIES: bifunctional DNA primase/polymerase [Thermomonospora]|uniref:Bifunctional DNA primase/polymerase n=1 Tax=Thermomonospora curvata (strain ATCC 19995 / DSM 43183 / JCM 3096 / KCTC 9072 / NBRC 15933 / NCIMB 10081 / Henssen B9) TaxID=471852 RepID=D1A489_THECD|nr:MULTISPECIES: bifunctional DNA primase/polymerase [Thermomonospora]ACY99963.1 Bifunctional DNA primase/polymerase [Thermomonospora curvata DSM 43183]PKK12262.1 MAG: DNA primase [Thermomonospora sp. CIF 1]
MLTVSAARRQRARGRLRAAAKEYAALGWPCVPGARPLFDGDRACSCDRVGCPAPGAHPVSAAWAIQATTDLETIKRWWDDDRQPNIILPTGRVFDVFDVPAAAGRMALERIGRRYSGPGPTSPVGPVAALGSERHLFFVATRGAPEDEDEWWSCHLDCSPETIDDSPGLRWHCRESYVVAPPSILPGGEVTWVRPPDGALLPDPVRVLEILSDCCEAVC